MNTRLALENAIWNRYEITHPNFKVLLATYLERSKQNPPNQVGEIEGFIASGLGDYLEPIPNMICSKVYSKEQLDAAGIKLIARGPGAGGWYQDYQDEKSETWWTDVEGRYGELVGRKFLLLGKDRAYDLKIS